jgi:hypothetical protein
VSGSTSWNKYILESIVIVASILMAFAIEAWWDYRQNIEEEREVLAFIVDETSAYINEIEDRLESLQEDQNNFFEFYNKPHQDLISVVGSDASKYFTSFYRPSTYDLSQSTIIGIVSSGRINVIRNPKVRESLEDLGFQASRLQRRNVIMQSMEATSVLALGKHKSYRDWNINTEMRTASLTNLTAIKEDEEVLSAANGFFLQRRIYLRYLNTLRESLLRLQHVASESN